MQNVVPMMKMGTWGCESIGKGASRSNRKASHTERIAFTKEGKLEVVFISGNNKKLGMVPVMSSEGKY